MLSGLELGDVQQQLGNLEADYQLVKEASTDKRKQLLKAVGEREALTDTLQKVATWMDEKEKCCNEKENLPLMNADVRKKLDEKMASVKIFIIGSFQCTFIILFILL